MEELRKRLDLSGQQYGNLTVLRPAENVDGRTAWLCRCGCGREAVVKIKNLRSGHRSTCGMCQRRGIAGLTYIDGTCVEMLRKRPVRKNNTSGVTGVLWRADKEKWSVSLTFKGRRHSLGYYKQFDDAVRARREAEAYYFDNFLHEFAAALPEETAADSNKD